MKNIISMLIMLFLIGPAVASAQVQVKGYFNKNGKYVQSHYRTKPDKTRKNNWSTYPNINPYTGKRGKRKYSGLNYYRRVKYPKVQYQNKVYKPKTYKLNYIPKRKSRRNRFGF